MPIGTRVLIVNKVGNLMEVKADTNGDLDLYSINLEDKDKLLNMLVKSDRNYKTKAVILNLTE
jgi:hypothetical protein